MTNHWACERYGVPRLGVVVLVDEAAKDLEVNVWSGIVHDSWSEDVKGCFLFGDNKLSTRSSTQRFSTDGTQIVVADEYECPRQRPVQRIQRTK